MKKICQCFAALALLLLGLWPGEAKGHYIDSRYGGLVTNIEVYGGFNPDGSTGSFTVYFSSFDWPSEGFNAGASNLRGDRLVSGSSYSDYGYNPNTGYYDMAVTVYYDANTGTAPKQGDIYIGTGMQGVEFDICGLVQPAQLRIGTVSGSQRVSAGIVPGALSVSPSSGGPTTAYGYQWQQSTTPGVETSWSNIAGANGPSYQPGPVTETMSYRLRVSSGSATKASNYVTVTMVPRVAIGISSGNGQTVVSGQQIAPITASASGGENVYTYRWYWSFDRTNWTLFQTHGPTADRSHSIVRNPSHANDYDTEVYYKATVDSHHPADRAEAIATITVRPTVAVSVSPAHQTVHSGNMAAPITATARHGDGTYTYRWEWSDNNTNWNPLQTYGPTREPSHSIVRTPTTDRSEIVYYYRATVTSAGGSTSATARITVDQIVAGGSVSSSQSVGAGMAPAALNLSGTLGLPGESYQWQQSTDASNWGNIAGATGRSYTPPAVENNGESNIFRYYRVVVANGGQSATSGVAALTIYPAVRGGIVTGSQQVGSGMPAAPLVHSGALGGDGNFALQWQTREASGVWSDIPGATGASYTPPALTNGSGTNIARHYRVVVTATATGQRAYSTEATVTVYPSLAVEVQPGSQTIFSGNTAREIRALVSGGNGSYIYRWEISANGSTWSTIAGATGAAHAPGVVVDRKTIRYYRVTVTSAGQSVAAVATITIEPTMGSNVEFDYYEGFVNDIRVLNDFDPTGGEGTLRLDFLFYDDPGGGFSVSASSSQFRITGSDFQMDPGSRYPDGAYICAVQIHYAANTGDKALNGDIYVSTGMHHTEFTIKNLVQPAVLKIPALANRDQTISQGNGPRPLSVAPTGGNGFKYLYQWQTAPLNSADWSDIAGATGASYTPPAPPAVTGDMAYRVLVTGGVQSGISGMATVRLERPTGSITGGNQTVSSGARPDTLVAHAQGGYYAGNYTYQWQQSDDNRTWSTIAGATADSYQPEARINEGTENIVRYYRFEVDASGLKAVSDRVSVTVLPRYAVAPNTAANYVITYRPRQALGAGSALNSANSAVDITYYDGLGRPEQQIAVAASPAGRDVVTPMVYDAAGRADSVGYLPYASAAQTNGQRKANPLAEQRAFYTGLFGADDAARAFVETTYEASPLDRVLAVQKPGEEYETAGKQVAFDHRTNTATEVRRLVVGADGGLTVSGHWPAEALVAETTVNEDGLETTVFTDLLGRKVLERSTADGVDHDTYYAHDLIGRLRYVMSPEGSAQLTDGATYTRESELWKLWGYSYVYDARGNLLSKRLPGADEITMSYDICDRMVTMQDGNLRAAGQHLSYVYDNLDRLTEQWKTSDTDPNRRDSLLIRVYDTYAQGMLETPRTEIDSIDVDIDRSADNIRGMLTIEHVTVLGAAPGQPNRVYRAYYYDRLGRPTQLVEHNHLGGVSVYTTQYDFAGNVVKTHERHELDGVTHNLLTENTYDDRGRLVGSVTTLDGTSAPMGYAYNELGQLAVKTFGELSDSPTTYTYNIQGWQTGQSSSRFTSTLDYFSMGGYAGNIAEWFYGRNNPYEKMYQYDYDGFGRFTDGWAETMGNDLHINGYDRNGNILRFNRFMTGYQLTYSGNRLLRTNAIASDYTYDANGNMTSEPRWALNLEYNVLNLLRRITRGGSMGIQVSAYGWLADGTKVSVRRLRNDSTDPLGQYDYLGSLSIQRSRWDDLTYGTDATFSEGYIRDGVVTYFEKDHLGSVRVSMNSGGVVTGWYDYYPSGKRHTISSSTLDVNNRWYFNGKEVQEAENFQFLDYGARMYYDDIQRWLSPDPLAEKYYSMSPYAFSGNNPVRYVDPNGRDWNIAAEEDPNGNTNYRMTVNASLINNSSSNFDMGAMHDAIYQQIMDVYNFSGNGFSVEMDLNLRTVGSVSDIGEKDHVFQIVDQSAMPNADAVASADFTGLNIRIGTEAAQAMIDGTNTRTMAHELGHSGGLRDNPRGGVSNLMTQSSYVVPSSAVNQATRLSQGQIGQMEEAYRYGRLNRNSPVYSTFGIGINQGVFHWGTTYKLRIR